MGLQQSKEELLYEQVRYGNVEGIKALYQEGVHLEWRDADGKTPLIVACMEAELYDVAKTLIELGADVDFYRSGKHAGTPLHHAAKRGLDQTVKLLLSHGANALVKNDHHQSALDVARRKGFFTVVRAIESHICLFSGWLREFCGPGFLEVLAAQCLSRKMWVVVMPCSSRNHKKPLKLVLAIYPSLQDGCPRTTVALWKAKIEEPNLHESDPVVTIFHKAQRTRYKLASANEGDKQQLQLFYNACRGRTQAAQLLLRPNTSIGMVPVTALSTEEDVELAMAISASLLCAREETTIDGSRGSAPDIRQDGGVLMESPATPARESSSGWLNEPAGGAYNRLGMSEILSICSPIQENISAVATTHEIPGTASNNHGNSKYSPSDNTAEGAFKGVSQAGSTSTSDKNSIPVVSINNEIPEMASIPSAPPVPDDVDYGPIQYPTIDSTAVDLIMENSKARTNELEKDAETSSLCVICLDAPIEGACSPCGHMAGCMSCLNGIKAKKWGCPVCRAKIDQVLRLYSV